MQIANKIKLSINSGDVLDQDCDVLVNTTTSHLTFTGPLSKNLKARAGNEIEYECKEWIEKFGEVHVSCCAVTNAGNLQKTKYLIHVIGPDYKNNKDQVQLQLLESCIFNILDSAQYLKINSIAIPSISTG